MEPVLWIDFFKGIILLGPIYLLNLFTALFFPSASSLCVSVATTSTSIWLAVHWLPLYHILPFIRFAFFVLHVVKSISFSDWCVLFAAFVVLSYQNFWCMCLSRMVYLIFYYGRFGDKGVCVCGFALQKIVLHSKMDKDFCFACNKLLRYLTTEFGPVVIVIWLPSNYHHDPVEVVDQRLVVCVCVFHPIFGASDVDKLWPAEEIKRRKKTKSPRQR